MNTSRNRKHLIEGSHQKKGHCPYGDLKPSDDGYCVCYGCLDDLKEGLDDTGVQERRHSACNRTCVRMMEDRPVEVAVTEPLSVNLGAFLQEALS